MRSKPLPRLPPVWTAADLVRERKRRKRNANHMRRQRERCDALGQCRQCWRPAALKPTGKRAKLCKVHLAADWNRKLPYPLALEVQGELWYPLAWMDQIL